MKVNKTLVIMVVLLLAAFGGMAAGYQFYVKERMKELNDHLAREQALKNKIQQMQTAFADIETGEGIKPEFVLAEYRGKLGPWRDSVQRRGAYFDLNSDTSDIAVPEGAVPRYYYKEIYPKLLQDLNAKAYTEQTYLAARFPVPDPSAYDGQNPKPEVIEEHLRDIAFYTDIAELLIEHDAAQINEITIWPPVNDASIRSGDLVKRTTGLHFTMGLAELTNFWNTLLRDDQYWSVDALRINNTNLRNATPILDVQMLLTQARYVEKQGAGLAAEGAAGATAGATPGFDPAQAFARFSLSRGGGSKAAEEKEERSWWSEFRRAWLPF